MNLKKMKKTTRGIYLRNMCAKFQNRRLIYERDTLPQSLRTHTQTHFNCQILAQLKLRIKWRQLFYFLKNYLTSIILTYWKWWKPFSGDLPWRILQCVHKKTEQKFVYKKFSQITFLQSILMITIFTKHKWRNIKSPKLMS